MPTSYPIPLSPPRFRDNAATSLTTQPWSAVERIADPQPPEHRFLRNCACCSRQYSRSFQLSNSILGCASIIATRLSKNRLALVGEESVSGVTAELPPGQTGIPTHAHLHHRQRRNHDVPQGAGDTQ